MNTKEKKLLKKSLQTFVFVLIAYILLQIITVKTLGNDFKDYLFNWDWQEKWNELEPDQIRIEFDHEGIISLKDIEKKDGWITYTLHPEDHGTVEMIVFNNENNEVIMNTVFKVTSGGNITDLSTGNFTNYREYHLNIVLLCIVLSIVLWVSFLYAHRVLRYSYQAIFYSGLAIWMSLITVLQLRVWFMEEIMVNVYGILQSAASQFMLYTSIPMLIFCIALSVSNISLIRHEGFRVRNALGILLSGLMIFGEIGFFMILNFVTVISDFGVRILGAAAGVYCSIYAFLECFLIGAILCGSLAASHEPKYEMDYLIILGCKVKPDGGLYPLIRGRVDRAISFYKKQLEKTGKKAVFVPSGGQGSDETISEADAMKRYLLEQGIPEEQILVENKSKNTVQNMVFSKKLIDERTQDAKVAFSTTNFHVFRSGIISRQNQFEPDGMGSKTKWYFWPNAYMREVIGMISYKWKAMIIVMIPIVLFMIAIQFVG